MPKFRIGYGSDFTIDSNGVGIGTSFAAANTKLDVVGTLKGDFNITGVTTLTAYGGFVAQNQHVNKASTIGFATVGLGTALQYYETETGFTDLGGVHHGDDQRFNTLSEDLVIDDGQILNITNTDMVGFTTLGHEYDPHNHSSYVCAGSLEQVSVTGHFSVPSGGINDRESFIEGTVRFNTDLNTLEFFNGNEWRQFTYNQGQSGRVIYAGGNNSGSSPHTLRNIEFLNSSTLGNTQNFGDLTESVRNKGGGSSSTRGVFGNGASPNNTTNTDVIEYITIASEGNSIDFGNSTAARRNGGGTSNSTRFLMIGGYVSAASDVIDYVEISTIGNALDFGDLRIAKYYPAGISSPIRAVFAGGTSPGNNETMSFVSIASKGDSTNFGDLSSGGGTYQSGGPSDGVRGILGGVSNPTSGVLSYIENITIASEGNTTHFGNLSVARNASGASGGTRGIFAGGGTSPGSTYHNIIDYVTIASAGDAIDFGDISHASSGMAGVSDSHGGLGGF